MRLSIDNQSTLAELFANTSAVSFTVTEKRTNMHNLVVPVHLRVTAARVAENTFDIDIRTDCVAVHSRRHDWEEDYVSAIGDPRFSLVCHENKNLKQFVYSDSQVSVDVATLVALVEEALLEVSFYQRGLEDVRADVAVEAGSYPTPDVVLSWLRSPQVHV